MGNRTSVKEAERLACQLVPFVSCGTLIFEFREYYPTDAAYIKETTKYFREAGDGADDIVSYLEELAEEDEEFGGVVFTELICEIKRYIARRKAELGKAV